MSILHQVAEKSNSSPSQFSPELEPLHQRLNAGGFVRCAGCYGWTQRIGLLTWSDPTRRPCLPYALCELCWLSALDDTRERRRFFANVASYLLGEAAR